MPFELLELVIQTTCIHIRFQRKIIARKISWRYPSAELGDQNHISEPTCSGYFFKSSCHKGNWSPMQSLSKLW